MSVHSVSTTASAGSGGSTSRTARRVFGNVIAPSTRSCWPAVIGAERSITPSGANGCRHHCPTSRTGVPSTSSRAETVARSSLTLWDPRLRPTPTGGSYVSTRSKPHARKLGRSMRAVVSLVVVPIAATLLSTGTAHAGLGIGAAVNFPTVVTVGDAGVPASIQLQNNNTLPDTSGTVCNAGDPFPCPGGDPGITLIPSCGQLGAFAACAPAGADPGVFKVSPSGVGEVGTACAALTFSIDLIDPVFGQLRFTPQPPGTHVVLPSSGSICRIDFTLDVLKTPSIDQNPATAGLQTVQVVDFSESDLVSLTASARATSLG